MHETSSFNDEGRVESEGHEVSVDVVKHAVRGVNLGGELSDGDNDQNHGNTRSEEDVLDDLGHSKSVGSLKRRSTKVDSKVDEDNHELTSYEVTIQVVSLVSERADLVGDGVRFLVKVTVDGGKTDHGALSSFDHGHPKDSEPENDDGESRVDVVGDPGIFVEHETHDCGNYMA